MELIRPFEGLSKDDASIAGGKGASLGELTQAGIPVPPGFVLTSSAFEQFLKETDLNIEIDSILHTVNHDEMHTVEHASEKIQELIHRATMPEDIRSAVESEFVKLDSVFVAVRSSATAEDGADHAWAGQLDTYLNTTKTDLMRNVQRCWASLFTPRAIFYRFEKGLHGTPISVAVVVQKMVQSEVSGIAFSVHPVTEDRNQMIIEAGFGLGEAIVSGQVTPDSFVIEKVPRRIIDKNISYQSRGLWKGAEGGSEWRELSESEGSKPALSDEQALELATIVMRIEEHYGFPCDIEWAFEGGDFYITQSRPITTLSAQAAEASVLSFKADKVSGLGGSIFALSSLLEVIRKSNERHLFKFPFYALSMDDTTQKADEWIDEAIYGGEVEKVLSHVEKNGVSYFENVKNEVVQHADELHGLVSDLTRRLPTLTDEELAQEYSAFMDTYTSFFSAGAVTFLYEGMLSDFLSESLRTKYENATDEIGMLLRSSYRSFMLDDEERLFVIKKEGNTSEKSKLIDAYRKEFYFIKSNFSYTAPLTDAQITSLANEASEHEHLDTTGEMKMTLTKEESNIIALLRVTEVIRDQRKRTNYIGNFTMFRFLDEACRRNACPISVAQRLYWNEFPDFVMHSSDLIEKLKLRTAASVILENGRTYYLDYNALSPRVALDASLKECRGTPACRGRVTARANIILTTADFDKFKDGDVLITEMTRPEFVPIMKRASAIITDEGGLTCHAAIVSRELKKPCIIGTKVASQIFKDGDMLEVDAERGTVILLNSEESKVVFEHMYTRDTTLITQQAWCTTLEKHRDELALDSYKDKILTLHYLHDGVIEIWENITWSPDLIDKMLESNKASDKPFMAHIENHQKMLEKFRPFWERGVITNVEELVSYVDTVFDSMNDFDWIYYPAMDERTPASIREHAMTIREKDVYFDETDKLIRKSLAAIYPELSGYEQCILRSEIQNPPTIDTLRERKRHFVIVGEHTIFPGTIEAFQKAHPELLFRFQYAIEGTRELKGQIGNKGRGRGRVRIMKRKDQVGEMIDGDILVSTMTTPDFIPAMKKAAAIVTDEGGVTCHAAIFSRELGVPCLIGTKFATQVFKNGDVVEVDADKGIVRILESANALFEQLKSEDYRYFGYYQSLPLAMWFWNAWYSEQLAETIDMSNISYPGYLMISDGHTLVPEKTVSSFRAYLEEKIANEALPYFDTLAEAAKKEYTHAVAWAESIDAVNSDPADLFSQFVEHGRNVMFFWASGWLRSQAFGKILEEKAREAGIQALDIPSYIDQPETPMLALQGKLRKLKKELEEKDIWEKLKVDVPDAIRLIEMDATVSRKIREHLQAYDWIQILNLVGQPLTIEALLAQISYLKPEHAHEANKKAPAEFALYADISSRISYVHQAGAEYFSIISRAMFPVLEKIQEKAGITRDELLLLLPEELFVDGEIASNIREIISRRARGNYALITTAGGEVQITDDPSTVQMLIQKFIPKVETNDSKEIKGQIGNKGKATGIVRVIRATNEFHKMQDGDVLVTPMTTPDFVILMQRASAIVTDMGGLLCHAAIVSRELGKPCVIDTKFATQVFKDGDMVEVDANNGTVRVVQDLQTIDWELWIRRQDQPPFFNSIWIELESQGALDLIGGGFTKQLCLRWAADNWWLRSTTDFGALRAGVRTFLNNQSRDSLTAFFDKVRHVEENIPRFLQTTSTYDETSLLNNFDDVITTVEEALLCTTSMPWFVLDTLEKSGKDSISNYDYIVENCEALRATSYYRQIKNEVLDRISTAIAKRFKISSQLAESLTVEEMRSSLKKNSLTVSKEDLVARETCAYWDMGGAIQFSFDLDLMARLKRKIEPQEVVNTEVRGAIAYKGVVRGTVRIVMIETEMHKVTKGDILVASSTNPALLPAMAICGAIVTDEGGIGSHAAIVARELRKPCVIGTKNATRIFKDGDMVEVDAEKGIVRKL